MKKLKDKGIASQIHYIPLHKHNYIKKKFKFSIVSEYSGADNYYSKILTLPLHMNLNSSDINYISKELLRILGKKIGIKLIFKKYSVTVYYWLISLYLKKKLKRS